MQTSGREILAFANGSVYLLPYTNYLLLRSEIPVRVMPPAAGWDKKRTLLARMRNGHPQTNEHCVNLLAVSYGMVSGWSSAALPTLQTPAGSPLAYGPITQHQASWIGGALCLGGIVGTFVGGAIVERIGRKWTAWVAGLPLVVCWMLVIVADHPGYLMGARFLGGLAGGIEFVVTPLYVSEIACTGHRGTLSSLLILSCCLGVELAYLAGAFLHYHTIPWASIGVPVFFLISFCFLPETPSHLAKVQKLEAAERSLRFFRGIRSEKDVAGEDEYVRELQLLHTGQSLAKDPAGALSWTDFS
uniref:Major facilitator superfamily (MFS) profile domain-containing protein n=1 Tax=Anopheles culicifacies TaxID=139723 RepID=A0A182MBR3_9DIPT